MSQAVSRPSFVIAIDGPAASGKGTVASRLARHYGFDHLDTGLLYRAVGVHMTRHGLDLSDETAATEVAKALNLADLADEALIGGEAGEAASRVAVHPSVREALFTLQRDFTLRGPGVVIDGRDIGTVIAPDASVKLFVTASAEVRADRRHRQLLGRGETLSLDTVLEDIRRRDARDSGRSSAPLVMAKDAHLLDTSNLGIEEAVDAARRIVEAVRA